VIDAVGAPYFVDNLDSLAMDGRLVLLSTMGGATLDRLDLRTLFRRRLTVVASTLRNRSDEYKTDLVRGFTRDFGHALASGSIRPVIHDVRPWDEVADAHRDMEAALNIGKIVLRVAGSGSTRD
jgi:NADPH:quinone reductase-like Zn-dependent oxidoreductase